MVAGVREGGGIWTLEDLHRYRVVERRPVYGEYHGIKIVSAAPPSSGGVVLVEMLNVLSGYPLEKMRDVDRVHLIVEAMRRAYRDRAQYLGDPEAVAMPIKQLTSPLYAAGLRAGIRSDRATPSAHLPGYVASRPQARDTTHFSVIDRDGNRVAATLSINYPFGSGFMPQGTGILLNDEMDDFAIKPGSPNVYGLVGAEANAIGPGRRMLSSMTPSFLDDGQRVAILGTPGGSRIITMLLLASLEFAEGASAQDIVQQPRFHHQYLPDEIQIEPRAMDENLQTLLQGRGHHLRRLENEYGNMQAVIWDRGKNRVSAAADPRGIGEGVVKYLESDN
jgi:gamma-glutamyltranspeptidase/glutathione hydrolase